MMTPIAKENVKFLGRAYACKEGAWCAYSGSGIEFKVIGEASTVRIEVTGDSTASDPKAGENQARIGIVVNRRRVITCLMDEPVKTFEVPVSCGDVVRVLKLSESAMSTMMITGIDPGSTTIAPTEDKDLFIEIVGDSITCGYGVEDEDPLHHFRTETEDNTKSYSYRTVTNLDADYAFVSLSGYGIISGYSDDGETRHPEQLIPLFYEKVGFSYGNLGGVQPQDVAWDFENHRTPDVVVINLGTNDDSYCVEHADRRDWYRDDYVKFLKVIRARNPKAIILCTLGMMGTRLCDKVEEAVALFRKETGDEMTYAMPFEEQRPEDGLVADYHPTEVTHRKAAIVLSKRICELLRIHSGNEAVPSRLPAGGQTAKRFAAVTFDDGPNTDTTPEILKVLAKHGVKGSFFVNGCNIDEETGDILKAMDAAGHEINNHTFSHPGMPELTREEMLDEVDKTDALIEKYTGHKASFFRPPYIAVSEEMYEVIPHPFIEGHGCDDWNPEVTIPERIERTLQGQDNGMIILLHDAKENVATAEALDDILTIMQCRGYEFLTLTELFRVRGQVPAAHEKVIYSYV